MALELIAFDADDTLWHNEFWYREGHDRFREVAEKYEVPADFVARREKTEIANIAIYGYGPMSFVLSMIETLIEVTDGKVAGEDILRLLDFLKEMISADVRLVDGVIETLSDLSQTFPLMLITKGELANQEAKVERSGLGGYFKYTQVVSEKNPDVYREILDQACVPPDRFMMIGNSMRSDIVPVLALGGYAIHVPNERPWIHDQVESPELPADRFFEASDLSQAAAIIRSMAARQI